MRPTILLPICLLIAGKVASQTDYSTNPDARRTAALAKVQGYTGGITTPKGGQYTYNYEPSRSAGPVTYSKTDKSNVSSSAPKKTTSKGAGSNAPKTTVKGPAAVNKPTKPTAKTSSVSSAKSRDVKPVSYRDTPAPVAATTLKVNGHNQEREVRSGRGQEGNGLFAAISELHYVQFGVYCKDVPVDKAPAIEGLYLLWHPGTNCPNGERGASYIVKGYTTVEEAKVAVKLYRASRIDCWYNPALSGAEVEIIGVR
jgi:hypothetical protein